MSTFTSSKLKRTALKQSVKSDESKTIKTPKQGKFRRSYVFIGNFEHILHLALVILY